MNILREIALKLLEVIHKLLEVIQSCNERDRARLIQILLLGVFATSVSAGVLYVALQLYVIPIA